MKFFFICLLINFLLLSSVKTYAQYEDEYVVTPNLLGYDVPLNLIILNDVLQKDKVLLKQNKIFKITLHNVRDSISNKISYIDTNGLVTKSTEIFKGSIENFIYEYDSDKNLLSITASGKRNMYDYKSDAIINKATGSKIIFDYAGKNVTSISGVRDSSSHFKYNLFYNENNSIQKYIFAEDHIFIYSNMDNLDTTYVEYDKEGKAIFLKGKNYGSYLEIKYKGDTVKLSFDKDESYGVNYIIKDNRIVEAQLYRDANNIIYRRFFYYSEKGLLIKKVYKNDFDGTEFELLFTYEYYE